MLLGKGLLALVSWVVGSVSGAPGMGKGIQGCQDLESQRENSQRDKKFIYSHAWVRDLEKKKNESGRWELGKCPLPTC